MRFAVFSHSLIHSSKQMIKDKKWNFIEDTLKQHKKDVDLFAQSAIHYSEFTHLTVCYNTYHYIIALRV